MITTDEQIPAGQPENAKSAHAKKQAQAVHLRKAMALAARVNLSVDGSRSYVRFSQVEVLEHWLLLISFAALGLTGLLQRFASISAAAWIINTVFGGLSTMNTVHRIAAVVFVGLSLFHLGRILVVWFVKREPGSMLPRRADFSALGRMVRYNLGSEKERPQFGRFTIDEKFGYWALVVAAPIMIGTGLILWFPTVITQFVPVNIALLARGIHSMTAIVAVVMVLTWHLYFTVIKERNQSIFSGLMSEQAMQENHPLEYQDILTAYNEVENLTKEN